MTGSAFGRALLRFGPAISSLARPGIHKPDPVLGHGRKTLTNSEPTIAAYPLPQTSAENILSRTVESCERADSPRTTKTMALLTHVLCTMIVVSQIRQAGEVARLDSSVSSLSLPQSSLALSSLFFVANRRAASIDACVRADGHFEATLIPGR